MEKNILQAILDVYCEKYDEFNQVEVKNPSDRHYEAFKWIATKHFQEHWDSGVEDTQYAAMFEEAFAQTEDLIDANVCPIATTISALKNIENVPVVRESFDMLFGEDKGDLDKRMFRIRTFIQKMNEVNQKSKNRINDWHLNYDLRTALACLNLYNPKDNYFYKYTELKAFCKMTGAEGLGSGENFSLEEYYNFCDELLQEIVKHKQIMNITAATLARDNSAVDDDNHILVYDVINNLKFFDDSLVPYFENKINSAKAEIEELQSKKVGIKSLVGLELESKKYGTGIVVSENTDRVVVKFPNEAGDKSFVKSYMGQGFFITDGEYLASLQENANIVSAVEKIEAQTKELKSTMEKVVSRLTNVSVYLSFHEPSTYAAEVEKGILWMPKYCKGGSVILRGYKDITALKEQDIVLNSVNAQIVGFFIVSDDVEDVQFSEAISKVEYETDARIMKCNYIKLSTPISTYDYQDEIDENLGGKGNAFDSDGKGTASFLGSLKKKLAKVFIKEILKKNKGFMHRELLEKYVKNKK